MIDGQPAMLTHLIRNLLNNAMLHGVPPVTILLYGVQTMDEADTVPDYLLQSIMDNSFADYNTLTDSDDEQRPDASTKLLNDYADSLSDTQADKVAATDISGLPDILSAPVIYRNGETLAALDDEESLQEAVTEVKPITSGTDNELSITEPIQSEKDKILANSQASLSEAIPTDVSNNEINEVSSSSKTSASLLNDKALINHYSKFTTEIADKIKKAIWSIVPNTEKQQQKQADNTSDEPKGNNAKSKANDVIIESAATNESDAANAPRKESLFSKHLKKSKSEPTPPLPKYAVLAVIDEGAGIPEDKREEIFSPFVRLQQKNKGSGLGLSLVSQIITAHQGHIITDTINGHTRFLVLIPVKHDPHHGYQNDRD